MKYNIKKKKLAEFFQVQETINPYKYSLYKHKVYYRKNYSI